LLQVVYAKIFKNNCIVLNFKTNSLRCVICARTSIGYKQTLFSDCAFNNTYQKFMTDEKVHLKLCFARLCEGKIGDVAIGNPFLRIPKLE